MHVGCMRCSTTDVKMQLKRCEILKQDAAGFYKILNKVSNLIPLVYARHRR